MKRPIDSLQKALAYQLRGLIYAENKLKDELSICTQKITSPELRAEMQRYYEDTDNKLQKLERIFNYLMQEPVARKNEVIVKMIEETHHLIAFTSSLQLRDILMIGCFQNISAYKMAAYKTAYLFSVELEMDTATDLVQEILDWEAAASRNLASLSIHELNKVNTSAKSE